MSDIHLDVNFFVKEQIVKHLELLLQKINPDIFIILGDLSSHLKDFSENIEILSKLNFPTYFVPGNHDVWVHKQDLEYAENNLGITSPTISSWEKHDKWLKTACEKFDVHYLPNNPQILKDKILLLGNLGWYDYSYRVEKHNIPLLKYAAKTYEGAVWNDANYCYWLQGDFELNDQQVLDTLIKRLEGDFDYVLSQVKDYNLDIEAVIFILHHIPFQNQVFYKNYPNWDFFSAYMGSNKLGETIIHLLSKMSNQNVNCLILAGQTHFYTEHHISQPLINSFTVPLGYLSEAKIEDRSNESIQNWVTRSLKVFEV